MIKVIAMSALLASALPSSAMAAMLVLPETYENSAIVKVAGFCGPGWYRGPSGHCHPKGDYHRHCWWRAGVRHCH